VGLRLGLIGSPLHLKLKLGSFFVLAYHVQHSSEGFLNDGRKESTK
jgi:hypothetical protein